MAAIYATECGSTGLFPHIVRFGEARRQRRLEEWDVTIGHRVTGVASDAVWDEANDATDLARCCQPLHNHWLARGLRVRSDAYADVILVSHSPGGSTPRRST